MHIPAPLERPTPAKLIEISKQNLPKNYTFKEPMNRQSAFTSLRVNFVRDPKKKMPV